MYVHITMRLPLICLRHLSHSSGPENFEGRDEREPGMSWEDGFFGRLGLAQRKGRYSQYIAGICCVDWKISGLRLSARCHTWQGGGRKFRK